MLDLLSRPQSHWIYRHSSLFSEFISYRFYVRYTKYLSIQRLNLLQKTSALTLCTAIDLDVIIDSCPLLTSNIEFFDSTYVLNIQTPVKFDPAFKTRKEKSIWYIVNKQRFRYLLTLILPFVYGHILRFYQCWITKKSFN